MTKEATPQPWYKGTIQMPIYVILAAVTAGGGSGTLTGKIFGDNLDTEVIARQQAVEVVNDSLNHFRYEVKASQDSIRMDLRGMKTILMDMYCEEKPKSRRCMQGAED